MWRTYTPPLCRRSLAICSGFLLVLLSLPHLPRARAVPAAAHTRHTVTQPSQRSWMSQMPPPPPTHPHRPTPSARARAHPRVSCGRRRAPPQPPLTQVNLRVTCYASFIQRVQHMYDTYSYFKQRFPTAHLYMFMVFNLPSCLGPAWRICVKICSRVCSMRNCVSIL